MPPLSFALVSTSARVYSLRQLAVRAGVSQEWFRTWHIEHAPHETVVYPVADQLRYRIRFRHSPPEHWEAVHAGRFTVGYAALPDGQREDWNSLTDFVIPFADRDRFGPLFRVEGGEAECSADLLASTVLTLSRYEETRPGPRDLHRRFPGTASLAAKNGYTCRPIVDECGSAFRYVLRRLFPRWKPKPLNFRVHITHDVDEIGIPASARKLARRAVRGGLRAAVRDILGLGGGRTAALAAVLDTASVAARHGLRCAVYWKASPTSEFDSGYDIEDKRVVEVIHALLNAGVELGVHPGYSTFLDSARLMDEVGRLRNAFGAALPLGGRQHFLRWSPEMWSEWEKCGLAYDSSVGFSEYVGFRAGTCFPYRPWLIAEDRELNLIEVPLIAMDCALTGPMGLRGDEAVATLLKSIRTCREVGGVFTLLWHADSILEPVYDGMYERIVQNLAGYSQFDWQADPANTTCEQN